MSNRPTFTLLYNVAFFTYDNPHPERLGTAEEMIARVQVWAPDADVAIIEARKVAERNHREWISTVSVDAVQGVVRERISNDPANLKDEAPSLALV